MRKYIILLFISAFALGACDKNDDYTVREWTVASQLGISHGFHTLQPVLLVKANDDTSWRAVYEGIEGFDYEPGYEYKLRIKAKQLADPPQDASSVRYSLLELISKIPARSNIPDSYYPTFTMEVAPEPVSYYGELYLSVRFPEVGLNDWHCFVNPRKPGGGAGFYFPDSGPFSWAPFVRRYSSDAYCPAPSVRCHPSDIVRPAFPSSLISSASQTKEYAK